TSGLPTSPAWMMGSQPASAASACGRSRPWVSEIAPMVRIMPDQTTRGAAPDRQKIARQFLPAQASCRDPGTGPELRLPPSQLEREYSLRPEFGWITGNLCELSKGYFATTSLSSSPPTPASQSRQALKSLFAPTLRHA